MNGPASASGKGPRAVARGALVLAGLTFAAAALAQSLKIPDFRQEPPAVAPAPRAEEPCDRCGVIRSIRQIRTERPISVPKPLQSGAIDQGPGSNMLVGAVVALPMGERSDRPYVGGVGTPEMRERFSETSYEITIRLDNGGYTAVQRRDGASFRTGDRVRVEGGQLTLLTQ
jgi:hypothetical protein